MKYCETVAMDLYPAWKTIHLTCVAVAGAGFVLRVSWMLADSWLLRHPLTRVLPHVNDSLLLASAIGLALRLEQYPLVNPWLTAKLAGLLLYIALGSIALRRGRTKGIRAAAAAGALLAFGYILAVALTRQPGPFRALYAG